LARNLIARTTITPDYTPDLTFCGHILCILSAHLSRLNVPPQCYSGTSTNAFGALLQDTTQAHPLVICSVMAGWREMRRETAPTGHAQKKVKTSKPQPPIDTPLPVTAPFDSDDDDDEPPDQGKEANAPELPKAHPHSAAKMGESLIDYYTATLAS